VVRARAAAAAAARPGGVIAVTVSLPHFQ